MHATPTYFHSLWRQFFDTMDTQCVPLRMMMKDVGMRIRVEPQLREAFIRLCREKDVPAAQVLRAFMRDFIDREGSKSQLTISYTNNELPQFEQKVSE